MVRARPFFVLRVVLLASLAAGPPACGGAAARPARVRGAAQPAAAASDRTPRVRQTRLDESAASVSTREYKIEPMPGDEVRVLAASLLGEHPIRAVRYQGCVRFVADAPERSSVWLRIDMRTLRVTPAWLTGRVTGPRLLDVEQYPEASFVAGSGAGHAVQQLAPGRFRLRGDLTLHGVSRDTEVVVELEQPEGAQGMLVARAEFSLRRADFDLQYRGALEAFIDEDVSVRLALRARPEAGACAAAARPLAGGGGGG